MEYATELAIKVLSSAIWEVALGVHVAASINFRSAIDNTGSAKKFPIVGNTIRTNCNP